MMHCALMEFDGKRQHNNQPNDSTKASSGMEHHGLVKGNGSWSPFLDGNCTQRHCNNIGQSTKQLNSIIGRQSTARYGTNRSCYGGYD
jgi:hypothetical protein